MKESSSYIIFNKEQLSKIGNTMLYLAEKINYLSKTKLLKLIYILDELSIKKSGIPFLNLEYKVWKFGPVSEELFIDLSSSHPTLMKEFIKKENDYIKPNTDFDDSEFSDNDIELMDFVIKEFGNTCANELVYYTHKKGSLWYNLAKENGVLELLESEEISNTKFVIDLSVLIENDPVKKQIYQTYLESN